MLPVAPFIPFTWQQLENTEKRTAPKDVRLERLTLSSGP
jgi:hypothetical protein